MTKRKGDFRSKIDSILAEGETATPAGKIASLVSPTTETKTDKIEIGKIFLPKGRKPSQDVSELLSSVRSRGVLQPLLLRQVGNRFEVVDGARRFVAAQQTGRKTVPAVVRKLSAAEARATASKDRPIVARSTAASRAAAAASRAAAGAAAAAAKPAAKTVTASKAKAVRRATGQPAAKPRVGAVAKATAPAMAVALPASAAAGKSSAKAAVKPATPGRAGKSATVRPVSRAPRSGGVRIFGEAAPAAATDLAAPPPAAPSASAKPASMPVAFPRLPGVEEPEGQVAAASAGPTGYVTETGPRLSRSRAMVGWYVFLAVLAVASFSLTNLAINHDTNLSIESGAVAAVGLVAVVIVLVTGQ